MPRQLTKLALALIVAVSLTGVAIAHEHNYDNLYSANEYGYRNGYQDGFQHGREDRRAGAGYNFRSRDYNHAMSGYESYMGSKHQYKDGYRRGYIAGYNDGFRGRETRYMSSLRQYNYGDTVPRYERAPGYGRGGVAFQIGYKDGLIAGGKDRRENKKFKPTKHDRYEDADHGYTHDYGKKKDYKRQYREGFVAGYERGYGGLPRDMSR